METNLEQWKPIGWLETKTKTRVETNSEKAKLVQWIKHSNQNSTCKWHQNRDNKKHEFQFPMMMINEIHFSQTNETSPA